MNASLSPDSVASPDVAAVVPQTAADVARIEEVAERRRKAEEGAKSGRIAIIAGSQATVNELQDCLADAGYSRIYAVADPQRATELITAVRPDLLLVELHMPAVSGLEVLAGLAHYERFERLSVLMLSPPGDRAAKEAALNLGAADFVSQPLDPLELLPRVRNALVRKKYQDRLTRYAGDLEDTIRTRTHDLTASRQEVVLCLARAAEYRDDVTGRHVIRVGKYVGALARKMRFTPRDVELLELAAQLHDIGKIGIPDAILKKPAKLTPEEYAAMKRHCAMGLHILRPVHEELGIQAAAKPSPLLSLAGRIAATHHERWDGTGYPFGLKGEDIPIEGRLTAVADVFDSLSSARPYKKAFPLENCLQALRDGSGTHFDPRVIEVFFAVQEEICTLRETLKDPVMGDTH